MKKPTLTAAQREAGSTPSGHEQDSTTEVAAEIMEIRQGNIMFYAVGDTPLIMNRLTEKARQELLFPSLKKNRVERATTLKHDPLAEYRSSVYRVRDSENCPTRVYLPGTAFKAALADSAVRIPGVYRTEISQLCSCPWLKVPIYGVPQLSMMVVQEGGMSKTPNIRTRAIFPRWCARIPIRFVQSLIKEGNIINLMGAAGLLMGVGDYRPQKGAGNYGQFRCVGESDADFASIVAEGSRAQQDEALVKPDFFDIESEDLYSWFVQEAARREMPVPSLGQQPEEQAEGERRSRSAKYERGLDDLPKPGQLVAAE